MILVAASLVAGLGLFFVGLYFLTEHLKMLSGRRRNRPRQQADRYDGPRGPFVAGIDQEAHWKVVAIVRNSAD